MADIDTVRLLISDTSTVEAEQVFSNGEIQQFLDLEAGYVKLAAASALRAIAVNEALVLKVITARNLSTDGAKLAAALRDQANDLRAEHAADVDADAEGYFEIVSPGCSTRPELTGYPGVWP